MPEKRRASEVFPRGGDGIAIKRQIVVDTETPVERSGQAEAGATNKGTERKIKAKTTAGQSDAGQVMIERFFGVPKGYIQDEILKLRSDLGDHIIDYIHTLQDGVEKVIYLDHEKPLYAKAKAKSVNPIVSSLKVEQAVSGSARISEQAIREFLATGIRPGVASVTATTCSSGNDEGATSWSKTGNDYEDRGKVELSEQPSDQSILRLRDLNWRTLDDPDLSQRQTVGQQSFDNGSAKTFDFDASATGAYPAVNMIRAYQTEIPIVKIMSISNISEFMRRSIASVSYLTLRVGAKDTRPLSAMIDTGVELNIISLSICEEFGLPFIAHSIPSKAFNGTDILMAGVLETDVWIGSCCEKVVFYVVDDRSGDYNHTAFLGMFFVIQTKLTFTHSATHQLKASFLFGGARLVATVGGV